MFCDSSAEIVSLFLTPNHNWFVPIELWIICKTAIIVVIEFQYLFSILVAVQSDLDSSSANSS